MAQTQSEFAAADAKLKPCVAKDSNKMHIMACNSVAQAFTDARLKNVYQAWSEALKLPMPDEARDTAEIMRRPGN